MAVRLLPVGWRACLGVDAHRICFFFQAEDGIRDVAVTGVQTCALPISMAKAQSMNMTAHHVVALERTLAAPRGPKAVWLPAPPNAPARSAALPLWSKTTTINTRQLATKNAGNTQKNQRESASLHPAVIIPEPINRAMAHFIQPGISKTSLKT